MKKGLTVLSGLLGISIIALIVLMALYFMQNNRANVQTVEETSQTRASVFLVELPKDVLLPEWAEAFEDTITQDLLPVNPYSRPGTDLPEINGLVIHYVGNAGTTAKQNRSYFENLMETKETNASSHFIIGLEGEILQCVPLDEVSYASNQRNSDTLAIECCHPDETGEFTDDTYNALVKLTAYLCILYDLDPIQDIIRHYDVTGKECPKYFVDNENQWTLFKAKVQTQMLEK